MRIENERVSDDVIFDVDMTDEEFQTMLEYGKKNITDQELVNFAMRDIVKKQIDRMEVENKSNTILQVLENAAELGCPPDMEVDMWFRNLTSNERCDVLEHVEQIVKDTY